MPTRQLSLGRRIATRVDRLEGRRVVLQPQKDHLLSLFAHGGFNVVAMAASAGGLGAISDILAGLPAEFPAAFLIVQHLDPRHAA